jgi:hypothetical protein
VLTASENFVQYHAGRSSGNAGSLALPNTAGVVFGGWRDCRACEERQFGRGDFVSTISVETALFCGRRQETQFDRPRIVPVMGAGPSV